MCGCNQILKKKKRCEKRNTLRKMKTKISKYQKLKTKKDIKTTNGEKSFSSKRLLHSDLSGISSALHSWQTFSISVSQSVIFQFKIYKTFILIFMILYSPLLIRKINFYSWSHLQNIYLPLYSFTVWTRHPSEQTVFVLTSLGWQTGGVYQYDYYSIR